MRIDPGPLTRSGSLFMAALISVPLALAPGCSRSRTHASSMEPPETSLRTVGVTSVTVKPLERQLTVSSELVPFQEIDVYAKQSGYVTDLRVDYGTRVKKGDVMAVLEIPELEQLIAQDEAAIRSANDQVKHAENELKRLKAQYENISHPFYQRLKAVNDKQKGLIAQQEIDDAAGKDLAAAAQVDAGESALSAAQSQRDQAISKKEQDQVLFDYRKITAPFPGVVTQRYANYGTLMQAGTSSSTQVLPLVKLSEDDTFRLVIPVPESYVKYIKLGDAVSVNVPSLGKTFEGAVERFSVDVTQDTRTMHTEVDVKNPNRVLMPGLYAEATLTLERKSNALTVPVQAIAENGNKTSVLVVDMNNRIQNRDIRLGIQNPNDAEVVSGLNAGDRVVVSDRSGLKSGDEVRLQVVKPMRYQAETGQ